MVGMKIECSFFKSLGMQKLFFFFKEIYLFEHVNCSSGAKTLHGAKAVWKQIIPFVAMFLLKVESLFF